MKNMNQKMKLMLGAVAGLATMAATQAQVEITLTGSTAFRADVYRAVRSMYDAGFTENEASVVNGVLTNQTGNSGSTYVTWSGTMTPLFASQNVIVRTSWSGSVAGIQSVTGNLNLTYLTTTVGQTNTVSLLPDFSFADNIQNNTLYKTPVLEDNVFGVVCFTWVKSAGTPAQLDNVSTLQSQAILAGGILPTWQFSTNLPVDASVVNVINRDTGSGTRVVTFAETGYGVFLSSTGRKLVNVANCALGFVDDTVGFSSGGNVAAQLNGATCLPAIGYLSINDALTVTGQPANWLKWNGVPFSKDAVKNGQYTFWGYEHLMNRTPLGSSEATWRGNPASPAPASFLAKVQTELASSPAGIQLTDMNVQRAVEGGVVTP